MKMLRDKNDVILTVYCVDVSVKAILVSQHFTLQQPVHRQRGIHPAETMRQAGQRMAWRMESTCSRKKNWQYLHWTCLCCIGGCHLQSAILWDCQGSSVGQVQLYIYTHRRGLQASRQPLPPYLTCSAFPLPLLTPSPPPSSLPPPDSTYLADGGVLEGGRGRGQER